MARKLKSSVKGALMGIIMTGGWLLADLLLPEPWGDVFLFSAMAVVNIGVGWKLGKLYDNQSDKEVAVKSDAKSSANYEFRP
jgi:membrane protein implicated in regulation of membrane protease activity